MKRRYWILAIVGVFLIIGACAVMVVNLKSQDSALVDLKAQNTTLELRNAQLEEDNARLTKEVQSIPKPDIPLYSANQVGDAVINFDPSLLSGKSMMVRYVGTGTWYIVAVTADGRFADFYFNELLETIYVPCR